MAAYHVEPWNFTRGSIIEEVASDTHQARRSSATRVGALLKDAPPVQVRQSGGLPTDEQLCKLKHCMRRVRHFGQKPMSTL
jgi:hypothetical protein